MSSTPEPMDTCLQSPEGSPPATAILPGSLALARAESDTARRFSTRLREEFEAKSRKLNPDLEPDEERPEPDPQASLDLASLGIDLAYKEKEVVRLERQVVIMEQDTGILHPKAAGKRLRELNKRYFSAGDDLWRHQKKKIRLGDPGKLRLIDPHSSGSSECILALYKKSDGCDKTKRRPSTWRQDSLTYYAGKASDHGRSGDSVWCHISGMWAHSSQVKAAHIVPHFLDSESIGEMLFGDRAPSLRRAGNSILLSNQIKHWFDTYHLTVVPVDAKEDPITRWKTDIIAPSIRNDFFANGQKVTDLDGKELQFLNDKRPVSRFLYFHFIMALIRIKDLQRHGWQDVWARYYEQRPFPTPSKYIRKSMLLALATHFETTELDVINSWIKDHGFDSSLNLNDDETTEASRRIHEEVEANVSKTEEAMGLEEDSSGEEDGLEKD